MILRRNLVIGTVSASGALLSFMACGTEQSAPGAAESPVSPQAPTQAGEGGEMNGSSPSEGVSEGWGTVELGAPPHEGEIFFNDAEVVGEGQRDFIVRDGVLVAMAERLEPGEGARSVELTGKYVLPAFVDSHIHLAYLPVEESLVLGGVLAAVDLAAPRSTLASPPEELELHSAGPMITAEGGYPTQGWGSNGYGQPVSTPEEARTLTEELIQEGARVIKIPFAGDPELSDEAVQAAVSAAHDAGLKVAAHALSNRAAKRAGELGCDFLAHTPTEKLEPEVIALWSSRAVVSTLVAFGSSGSAVENLQALWSAGATVLYGTDLGNLRAGYPSVTELELLREIGMTAEDVLGALTTVPAEYFGTSVGKLEVGGPGSFVVFASDPRQDLAELEKARWVFSRGRALVAPAP